MSHYYNPLTKAGYSPKNCQLLAEAQLLTGDECQEVAGFKQWLELGRCVEKGQHGTRIMMVCDKKTKDSDGTEGKKKVCKGRAVFFKSQTVELVEKVQAA